VFESTHLEERLIGTYPTRQGGALYRPIDMFHFDRTTGAALERMQNHEAKAIGAEGLGDRDLR
jgi:hypothetical protein